MAYNHRILFLGTFIFLLGLLLVSGVSAIPTVGWESNARLLQNHFSEEIYSKIISCCPPELPNNKKTDIFVLSKCQNPESIECKSHKAAYCCRLQVFNLSGEIADAVYDSCNACAKPYFLELRQKEDTQITIYLVLFLAVIPAIILISLITLFILKHKSKNKRKFRFWITLVIIIGIIYILFLGSQILAGLGY